MIIPFAPFPPFSVLPEPELQGLPHQAALLSGCWVELANERHEIEPENERSKTVGYLFPLTAILTVATPQL